MTSVYRYRLHRTLNFTLSLFFFIFTAKSPACHTDTAFEAKQFLLGQLSLLTFCKSIFALHTELQEYYAISPLRMCQYLQTI